MVSTLPLSVIFFYSLFFLLPSHPPRVKKEKIVKLTGKRNKKSFVLFYSFVRACVRACKLFLSLSEKNAQYGRRIDSAGFLFFFLFFVG
jgi:hypothetical protein